MRICSWYNLENILCAHSSYICSCSGAKEDGLKCISLQLYSAGHKMFQISTNYEYSTLIHSYMATNYIHLKRAITKWFILHFFILKFIWMAIDLIKDQRYFFMSFAYDLSKWYMEIEISKNYHWWKKPKFQVWYFLFLKTVI